MAGIFDFLTPYERNCITADITNLFKDPQCSVEIIYRPTGTISFAVTGSISEVNSTTITLPAIIGGYGRQAGFGGHRETEKVKAGSLLPETEAYFLVRYLAITDPAAIDRLSWDGQDYRVTAIRRDSLGSHYRIEVKRS